MDRSAPIRRSAARPKRVVAESILAAAIIWLTATGCGSSFPGTNQPSLDEPFSTLDLSQPLDQEGDDASDGFSAAELLPMVRGTDYTITGRIAEPADVDIFDVGALRVGDRLVAEVFPDRGFAAAIAAFNADGEELLVNDDRNVYLGRQEPFVDIVIRSASDNGYIAVSGAPGTRDIGAYTLAIKITPDQPLPEDHPQVVLLNFEGAAGVGFGDRPDVDIPVFSAASIDPAYAGDTTVIELGVTDMVRKDYTGLNVTILSTAEGASDDGTLSVIHFGTYDSRLLGVAEGVDEFNADTRQEAIVFTDTFSAFAPLNPSPEQLAQAIANVTSHEVGHLLGLVHTSDPAGIMDITASLSQMLWDQDFTSSPLHPTVFFVGRQNALRTLLDSVGGDSELIKALAAARRAQRPSQPPVVSGTPIDVDPRRGLVFGTCGSAGIHTHR